MNILLEVVRVSSRAESLNYKKSSGSLAPIVLSTLMSLSDIQN